MDPLQKFRRRRSCEVPSCYNNIKKNEKNTTKLLHSFFKIPDFNRAEARRNWLAKLNITEEFLKKKKSKKFHICDRHFCSNDYSALGSYIRLNAVPSLNLEYQENIPSTSMTNSDLISIYDKNDKFPNDEESIANDYDGSPKTSETSTPANVSGLQKEFKEDFPSFLIVKTELDKFHSGYCKSYEQYLNPSIQIKEQNNNVTGPSTHHQLIISSVFSISNNIIGNDVTEDDRSIEIIKT